jgi:predicted P-loop ATPase
VSTPPTGWTTETPDAAAAFAAAQAPHPTRASARQFNLPEYTGGDLLLDAKQGVTAHRDNLVRLLRWLPDWQGVLAIDEFAKRIVCMRASPLGHKAGDAWHEDEDATELSLWLSAQARFCFVPPFSSDPKPVRLVPGHLDTIRIAVRAAARQRRFNPLTDYLSGLQHDGKPRVDTWTFRLLGASATEYHRLVGRWMLINMIRRAFEPGCVLRTVVVLEGQQDRGKSSALRALANPWFADTPFRVGDKDAYLLIWGNWLYEIAELDSFSRAEATQVKAFISSPEDNFRAPYEASPAKHKRYCCFAATTNQYEWAQDSTGNTRFHPLHCGARIDYEAVAAERDQLFAEALLAYRKGERAHPTPEQAPMFEREVEARTFVHPWSEKLREYCSREVGTSGVTIRELMASGLHIDLGRVSPNGLEARKVGQIMQQLGYQKRRARVTVNGRSIEGREWRYYPPAAGPGPDVTADNRADYDDSSMR